MRTEVLDLLRKAGNGYISGEEIAKQLGVSRTAVWKHINELRKAGYDIESQAHLGYVLKEVPDLLLPAEMSQVLQTKHIGKNYVYRQETQSTNDDAKKLCAEGAPDGTVVVTEYQSGGHGRLTRRWVCPRGAGLLFSVILRPASMLPQEAPKCTLMAAVAVVRALRAAGVEAGIKWPNDILVNGKKAAGILTEMSASMESIEDIIIGIGINANLKAEDLPQDARNTPTSLAIELGHPVDRRRLLADILLNLETLYDEVREKGFHPMLKAWKTYSVTLGRQVRVIGLHETFSGRATGIDDDGALFVERPDGSIRKVLAGDVSIRPEADASAEKG